VCVIARRPQAAEAISVAGHAQVKRDCFASLAMTPAAAFTMNLLFRDDLPVNLHLVLIRPTSS
jgi:hypothetical protein